MPADRAALADLVERRAVGRRAIVAEIRDRERRGVLDIAIGAISPVGGERIVGAIDRGGDCERRELLIAAQGLESRSVAHSEVEAEVHVSRIYFADLESVIGAGGCALRQFAGE